MNLPSKTGFDFKRLNLLKPWMQRYIDERKYPGSSILIYLNGKEVFYHEAGYRDIARELKFQRDTVVRLYSMTKPVTSVALMMLVEKGLCHLDAPVSEFLPAFSDTRYLVEKASSLEQTESCASPTLHHLLTHTSGLTYGFNDGLVPNLMLEKNLNFSPENRDLAEVCDIVALLPLCFKPGNKWEYSVSIDILGRVVEILSGQSLADFFYEEIFLPLNMLATGFRFKEPYKGRVAALYKPSIDNIQHKNPVSSFSSNLLMVDEELGSPFWDTNMYSGGGGLVGTINDYMRFVEFLRTGETTFEERLLSPKTLDFMMRNHLKGDIASMGPKSFMEQPMEGMGFAIGGATVLDPALARTPGNIGDFSWGGMASTFFWIDRKSNLSVVFFTQLLPSSSFPSRSQLKAIIHGSLIE